MITEHEYKYLNIHGVMTIAAYRLLDKTHNIERVDDRVLFNSKSISRPNLEFHYSSMPIEILNEHKYDSGCIKC